MQAEEMFREIFAPIFAKPKSRRVESGFAVHGKYTKMAARSLYYNPEKSTAFSTLDKLSFNITEEKQVWYQSLARISGCLYYAQSCQEEVHKRYSYTVTNLMDVWEYDILYMQSLAKYNDMYRYILSVIEVFSKYLGRAACGHLGVSMMMMIHVAPFGYVQTRERISK